MLQSARTTPRRLPSMTTFAGSLSASRAADTDHGGNALARRTASRIRLDLAPRHPAIRRQILCLRRSPTSDLGQNIVAEKLAGWPIHSFGEGIAAIQTTREPPPVPAGRGHQCPSLFATFGRRFLVADGLAHTRLKFFSCPFRSLQSLQAVGKLLPGGKQKTHIVEGITHWPATAGGVASR